MMWIFKNIKSHKRRSSVLKKRQAAVFFCWRRKIGVKSKRRDRCVVLSSTSYWFSPALATEVQDCRIMACISSRKLKVELP